MSNSPSRPRIALVIDRFDGRRGGAALWTRGFAAWLAAHDCDVHILARTLGPAEARLPLTFHPIAVGRSPLAFAAAAADHLQAIDPLISHDMGAAIGCDVFQPHVGSGAACWNGSIDSYPRWFRPAKRLAALSPRRLRLGRLCAAQFAAERTLLVALSRKAARDMHAFHGVPTERIRVIHNGVDLSRFGPGSHHDDARVLIRRYFGVLDHEILLIAIAHHARLKGIPGLIRALHALRREGAVVKLLVCGGRAMPATRGAAYGPILHAGRVDDVAPFYAAADLCVHPTYYDACSLVTLEAMAAGLAVVTTEANGASELITHNINGIVLASPHTERTLTGALRALLTNDRLRHTLAAAARRLVQSHSVEKNYRQIAAVYVDALALRGEDATPLAPLLTPRDQTVIHFAASRPSLAA